MILIQLKEAAKFLKTSQNIRAVKCQNLIVDLRKKCNNQSLAKAIFSLALSLGGFGKLTLSL